jgi:hypothetical protein
MYLNQDNNVTIEDMPLNRIFALKNKTVSLFEMKLNLFLV